jgi:hypothetical protein
VSGPEGPVSTGAENERTTSVAEVLSEHVTLEVEGIDRMYLNVYVPQLQREQGVATSFVPPGHRFASSALMDPISKAFVAQMESLRSGRRFR